ncbi:hypothetical protein GF325_10420 [Candidatus Bathyarchaeota archaeon]|nr:hypothetical protein [Candidatus Bathyarchaeota archaeon]
MKSKTTRLLGISFLLTCLIQFSLASISHSSGISTCAPGDVKVLLLTQKENGAFEKRMKLDSMQNDKGSGIFDITFATNETYQSVNISDHDVIIVNSFLPENLTFIQELNSSVANGKGLFFWGGFYPALINDTLNPYLKDMLPIVFDEPFTIEEETYIDQSWVSQIELKVNDNYKFKKSEKNNFTLLQRSVVWESSPLVEERIFVSDAKNDSSVLVYKPERPGTRAGLDFKEGEPLVVYGNHSNGRVLWISMGVGKINATFQQYDTVAIGPIWDRIPIPGTSEEHNKEWNKPFYLWPYFNFFLYQTSMYLAKEDADDIKNYAKWPYSPIPHKLEAILWMSFVGGLWVFNFVLFFTLGRKKKREGLESPEGEKKPDVKGKEKPPGKEDEVESGEEMKITTVASSSNGETAEEMATAKEEVEKNLEKQELEMGDDENEEK